MARPPRSSCLQQNIDELLCEDDARNALNRWSVSSASTEKDRKSALRASLHRLPDLGHRREEGEAGDISEQGRRRGREKRGPRVYADVTVPRERDR